MLPAQSMQEVAGTGNLFAYGTLMRAELIAEVAGCTLPGEPATLRGYCRRPVRGEEYPAIIPDQGGEVSGVVYRRVPGPSWERLDQYEGEMYARHPVHIDLPDGTTLPATAYVARPEFRDRLGRDD